MKPQTAGSDVKRSTPPFPRCGGEGGLVVQWMFVPILGEEYAWAGRKQNKGGHIRGFLFLFPFLSSVLSLLCSVRGKGGNKGLIQE